MFTEDLKYIESIKKDMENGSIGIFYRVTIFMSQLANKIIQLENTFTKETINSEFNCVRKYLRESPLINRTYDWPNGYAGDYEIIEYIFKAVSTAPLNTIGFYIDYTCLNNQSTQQHRNKILAQAQKIKEVIINNKSARILLLACGSCYDIRQNIDIIQNSNVTFDLVDIDKKAIAFSKQKLSNVIEHCNFIPGNIYRILNQLEYNYDLILFGGVLDYINDKFVISLIKKSFQKLNENGQIFLTNISKGNFDRIPREYFFNWPLIERNEDDILNIFKEAEIKKSNIYRESTQLSIIGEIKK